LAERSDCHPNYIGGIERGERNPSLIKIAAIAKGLRCRIADLFPDGD
jgi:transcriptional regulator with XRE-family HTH domain